MAIVAKFGLAKYCLRELAGSTLLCGGLAGVALWLAPAWIAYPILAILATAWLWVLWFFRDPNRPTPQSSPGETLFICPADGNVTDITPLGDDSSLGTPGVQIGIFMNVFSVHVNRSPADAVVERVDHKAGCFMDVRDPVAWHDNESATIYLRHRQAGKDYRLVVRQIAGMIARRIVTDLSAGQSISAGQRIGMIKFGSRVELQIPAELACEICVTIGQKVQAGLSVLAKAKTTE
jgi:phosphatidylserine decarboxylase